MRFRVLGPVAVEDDAGMEVPLRSAHQRLLLALLLAADGAFVSADRLAEDLWPESLPADPAGALQTHVSRLRRALPDPEALETGTHGYRLVTDDTTDRHRFEQALAQAGRMRHDGDPGAARDLLDEALGLWRGPALADVADHPGLEALALGLDDARARAEEERIDALLDLGEVGTAAVAADALRREHPLRERPAALAMRVRYAEGRHADALAVYAELRRRLGEELGLEPSDELRELEGAVLRHELPGAVPGRRSDPPPVTRAAPVPRPRTRLIGRDEDVRRATQALGTHRLVTLVGPGGTGKTRLALDLVAASADVSFVDLTRTGPEEDLARFVAGQLGIEQLGPGSSVDRLVEALYARDLLLVLDNCEHVLAASAGVVDQLLTGTDRLRILATSREALAVPGERVVAVGPLGEAAAVELLDERAAAIGASLGDRRTDGSAAALCRLVDGLPLGVELAAAHLATSSFDEVLGALGDRGEALVGGARTAAPRHRSLDALVGWSYDDLDPADQAVLRALAVFAGPARADDVAAVVGRDAGAGLRRLVERSLVVRTEREGVSHFGLLETVRAFGRRRLEGTDELHRLRDQHARWAVTMAATAPTRRESHTNAADLRRVDGALDDLRLAHRWFLATDERDLDRSLLGPLWWYAISRVSSAVFDWAKEADDQWPVTVEDADDEGIRVAAVAAAGDAFQGSLADAKGRARRAIEASAGRGVAAYPYASLADAELFGGDPHAAAAAYRTAYEMDRSDGGEDVSSYELADEAMALAYAEDPVAVERADEALARLRAKDNPSNLAFGLYIAGEVRLEQDPDTAEAFLEEALTVARTSGNRLVAGVAAVSLQSVTARRDPRTALDELPDLLEHWLQAGLWTQLWTTMRLLIGALAATGEETTAARLLGAQEASTRAAPPYGADARRLGDLRARLDADLGADVVDRLVAEGRAWSDHAALSEALAAAERARRRR